MAPLSDINIIAGLGIVLSTLVTTGAITFFARYGTRLTVVEKMVETSQLMTLHTRIIRLEDAMLELKSAIVKLGSLDVIIVRLDGIAETLKMMVPRTEHEVRWRADEARFSVIENKANKRVDNTQ